MDNLQKSSHMIMTKSDSIVILSVPLHDDLDRGTLRGLIGLAGLAAEEFVELLSRRGTGVEKTPDFRLGMNRTPVMITFAAH
ncbi:MAG: type II toxin-antitoxin system HicA family toxin [Methanothrix sp.]|nr:type II toxin-antitoxin system HicA family toxin [Methanothrix sp.]